MFPSLCNETRILRREPALWILAAAYVGLLGYGCVQSVDRVRVRHTQISAARDDYERRWLALRTAAEAPPATWGDWRSPSLVGGPSGYAVTFIPVDGLAVLSAGESVRLPSVRRISIYSGDEDPPLENPLAPAGGVFDLSFVVIWLLPLTILAATHGAVSADRQRGTWSLIAATSSSPGRILAARLIWPAASLTAITVLGGTIGVLAAGPFPDAAGWLRLAAWSGVVSAYTLMWTLMAGVATARCRTAPLSLVSLGLVWILLVWIAPGLIDVAASAAVPPSNRLEAHIAARETQRDLDRQLPLMLEDVYTQHPEWRPAPETVAAMTRPVPGGPASRDSRRVYAPSLVAADIARPFTAAVATRRDLTEGLVRRLSLLSPALAVQSLGDHLAGTSAGRFVEFEHHAADAERAWHAFFAPRIMRLQEMTRADMDQIPSPGAFSSRPGATAMWWSMSGLGLAVLISALTYRWSLRDLQRV